MILNNYFQISVSIFCTLATIFMLVMFVWAIILMTQLTRLIKKLEEILEIVKITAADTKNFVENTIKSLESFKKNLFTFDFIGRMFPSIISLIKGNSKGKNGQED